MQDDAAYVYGIVSAEHECRGKKLNQYACRLSDSDAYVVGERDLDVHGSQVKVVSTDAFASVRKSVFM
jgi:hypothetical protein